ncbi:hypothetical protein [Actinocrispum sp. NPDC049592]|uniref:hypothetical protein n=1 Tax=Actinocrispum sp. NPDC049592 TaxID=3154835 RepID=UPI00342B750D
MRVHVQLPSLNGGPSGIGDPHCAVTCGVHHGSVGQHGDRHGLAQLAGTEGELDLLVVGGGNGGPREGRGGNSEGGGDKQCGREAAPTPWS